MQKTLKRLLLITVVAVTAISVLAGCSSSKPADTGNSGGQAQAQVVKIKFGHNQDTNSPQHRGAEAFKQKVEELSGGKIQVTIYPNMQLGQMREQAEQVQAGTLEMTQQPASVWSNFAPAVQAYDIPFLFANNDAMYEVISGPVGKEILKTFEEKGLKGLGYETGGLKNMTANFPIKSPQDLKGKKMRVMPAPILIETYKALGANPTPVEYGELYNALQQGVVDGQENPLQTISMIKLYEVQKHITMTQNGPMLYITAANKKWFDSLSPELQQNIIDAMAYADEVEWKDLAKNEETYLKEIKDAGMQVYYPTKEELQAFKDATKPVVDFIADKVGKDLVDKLLAAANEVNAKYQK